MWTLHELELLVLTWWPCFVSAWTQYTGQLTEATTRLLITRPKNSGLFWVGETAIEAVSHTQNIDFASDQMTGVLPGIARLRVPQNRIIHRLFSLLLPVPNSIGSSQLEIFGMWVRCNLLIVEPSGGFFTHRSYEVGISDPALFVFGLLTFWKIGEKFVLRDCQIFYFNNFGEIPCEGFHTTRVLQSTFVTLPTVVTD